MPNPSFEEYVSCPDATDQMDRAIGWSSYGNSPDYFNNCANAPVGIPLNAWGYQNPFNGNAYAFLGTYDGMNFSNIHEFIGCRLMESLIPGTKYFVSAYISRADLYPANGASNNFGFRFCNEGYSELIPPPIDNFSHIHSTAIVSDSINWTKISGSFIADSAYKYLILGNFYDNENTDTLDINNNAAGYYIDAVSVSTDSLAIITNTNSYPNLEEIEIFPKPVIGIIYIKGITNMTPYLLTDFTGKIVQDGILSDAASSIDVTSFSGGLYLLHLKNNIPAKIFINQ